MFPSTKKIHHLQHDSPNSHKHTPIHEPLLGELNERRHLHSEQLTLSILVVTWNLMGTMPLVDQAQELFTSERTNHDLVVVGNC